jgi:hypothetical protein
MDHSSTRVNDFRRCCSRVATFAVLFPRKGQKAIDLVSSSGLNWTLVVVVNDSVPRRVDCRAA